MAEKKERKGKEVRGGGKRRSLGQSAWVTKKQRVHLCEGLCINIRHYEKSNFLHLPANCSHADTRGW